MKRELTLAADLEKMKSEYEHTVALLISEN